MTLINWIVLCITMLVQPPQVKRVVDGDTFILYNVGVTDEERIRLLGVDAAELRDSLGPAARTFTEQWLVRGPFIISGCKRDSFGRILAEVTRGTDTLASELIRLKLGVPR